MTKITNQELFYNSIRSNNLNDVIRLSKLNNVIANNCDSFPLRLACKQGLYDIVEFLLDNSPSKPEAFANEAIRTASEEGFFNIVNLLLNDHRVSPQQMDNDAIISAYYNKHYDIVKLLLKDNRVSTSMNSEEEKNIINHMKLYDKLKGF
jgi:ankyrin repeat protein